MPAKRRRMKRTNEKKRKAKPKKTAIRLNSKATKISKELKDNPENLSSSQIAIKHNSTPAYVNYIKKQLKKTE